MKNRINQILVCIMIAFASAVHAQGVANYTFAASSGTYTALSGGTTWQSGATVSADALSSAITLPFNFTYNYASYSSIYISNNGFIVFGNQPSANTNYTPISQTSNSSTSTNGYDGAVAGFACNLVASAVSGAAPSIIYGTSGSDFVIQYTDMARTAVTTDRITFQIRLTQTTNVVSIVYNAATASASTTIFPQVGLRGASYFDWKNLTGSAATTWTAPTSQNTAGSAISSSNMRFTTTAPAAAPVAGQTFTWTPPAALSAPTYATLPATENFDAAPWANGNSTEQLPNATNWRSWPAFGDRSWRRIDATVNSASTGWASATGRPAVAAPASGGAACINSYDGPTGRIGYMDYYVNFSTVGTKTLTFSLISAGGYTLKVYLSTDGGATFTLMGTYNTLVAAWANQTLVLGTSTSSTCVVRFEGATSFGASGNNIAIDNVSITIAPCGPVNSAAATSVTSNSATANWAGGTGSYIIEYGPTGFTPGTGATAGSGSSTVITASAGATSTAITGLTPNTTYQYYVRQVCSGPSYSVNSSVQAFTTDTQVICNNGTLPYSEGFESIVTAGDMPTCMTASPISSSSGKTRTYTAPDISTNSALVARSGNSYAAVNWSPAATRGYFFSPALQLVGGKSYDVSVWYRTDGIAWSDATLFYGTNATPAAMTNVIARVQNTTATSYTQLKGTFTASTSGTYYIALTAYNSNTNPNFIVFDDFTVAEAPDLVWPGDANNSRLVDNNDLLPIGLAYNATGPARAVQGIVWQGDAATNWIDTFATGVNYMHADCNGDGTINANDTLAIIQNFGLTHTKTNETTTWRNGAPVLKITYSKDTVHAGDTLITSLVLGSGSLPVSSLYGLAYTFHYDASVVDSNSTSFSYINSWLGNPSNSISISKDIKALGQVKTAITGIDHLTRSGSGVIAQYRAVITTDNINGKDLNYYPNLSYISDLVAIDIAGDSIFLNSDADSNQVAFIPTGIQDINAGGTISIHPNPSTGIVRVQATSLIKQIVVTDITGQVVKVVDLKDRKAAVIDFTDISSGIYLIHITTEQGKAMRKLQITK